MDHYYLNGAQIWYSENNFPGGSGAEVKMIWVEGLTNFPTPKEKFYKTENFVSGDFVLWHTGSKFSTIFSQLSS